MPTDTLRENLQRVADSIPLDPETDLAASRQRGRRRRRNRRMVFTVSAAVLAMVTGIGIGWPALSDDASDVITYTRDPAPPPAPRDPGIAPGAGALVVTNVIELGGAIPPKEFDTDRIVATADAVWVGIDNAWVGETSLAAHLTPRQVIDDFPLAGALYRIDTTTKQVTDEIPLPAGVSDLIVESETLWALLADDTVIRIDLTSRQVTHTIPLGIGVGSYAIFRSDLAMADNGLWVAGGDGLVARVDLDTRTVETFTTPTWIESDGQCLRQV